VGIGSKGQQRQVFQSLLPSLAIGAVFIQDQIGFKLKDGQIPNSGFPAVPAPERHLVTAGTGES